VPYHRGDTCAFSAWDSDGLAVSAIQSLAFDFGSGVIAGETGILMQNRGTYFSLDERAANRLEPGKRTMHTLIPALLERDGVPWVAYGTQGGEGQPQTHAALVCRLVDFGYDVQQAIEAPRWVMGRTWGDVSASELALESRLAADVAGELDHRGHNVRVLGPWEDLMGQAQAIRRDPETGWFEGGADPRGDGAAVGF
jgi:gamma-glutamyltranspeptidase/glutathione hydrolase